MNKLAGRWQRAIAIPAFVGAMLTLGTGCGALKAAANPKVAWAINDPAPMSVVVRRADVAEKTSKEVDRLMTETPTNDDSPWLAKVGPDAESVKKDETEIKGSDLYAVPNGPRVVAAEIWAKELAQLEPKSKAAAPAPAAAPAAPATEPAKATASAAAAPASEKCTPAPAKEGATDGAVASNEPAEPTAKEAKPKKGKGKGKGATASKKGKGKKKKEEVVLPPPPDPNAADSAMAACAPASAATKEPAVSTTTTTSASVPAAPAPAAASNAKYASLLSAIDPNLGTEWSKVMEKKKAMGEAKAEIAALEAANDAKGVSAADKSANKAKISELEKTVDKLEKEAGQLSKELVPKAKAAAQKAPADIRDKFGPSLVNLRQAVADADISNSAAAVRYPMAATTLLDSAKQMAKVYVADIIEEQTGKRPNTQTLQPGVTMEGGSVQVTLNGLTASDLGKLSVADVTKETASRTTAWAKRALSLLGVIASTKEVLSFEDEVLGALIDGFTSAGWKAPAAAQIPDGGPPGGQGGGGPSVPSAPSLPKI